MGQLGRNLIRALKEANELYGNSVTLQEYSFFKRLWMSFWLSDLYTPIGKVETFITVQTERIKRLYAYGKYLWAYGEWDSAYSLGLLELNLRRLKRIMENGSSVFSKSRNRRMAIAIEMLKRMQDSNTYYSEPAFKDFDKRWGFVDRFELLDHPEDIANPRPHLKRFYTSRHQFRDSLPKKERIRYDKEYKELLLHEDKMFKRDMEVFCKIFSKDVRSWWD